MSIQRAANEILSSRGVPLPAREIAALALDAGMEHSGAQNPVDSMAQTIEKNFGDGVYDSPSLVFIRTRRGRHVGRPSMAVSTPGSESQPPRTDVSTDSEPESDSIATTVQLLVPEPLARRVVLASHSEIWTTVNETFIDLIRKGLSAEMPRVREALSSQLPEWQGRVHALG